MGLLVCYICGYIALYVEKGQSGLTDLSCRKITGLCVVFLLSYVDGLAHRLNIIRFCASLSIFSTIYISTGLQRC